MAPRIRILSLNIGLKSDLAGLGTLIKIHKLKHIMYKIAYVAAVYNKINKKFVTYYLKIISIDVESYYRG